MLAVAGLIGILVWSNARQRHSLARLVAEKYARDTSADEADRQRRLAERHLHGAQLRLAGQALDDGQFERAQDILHDLEPGPGDVDLRGFAWHALWRRARRDVVPMYGHDRDVHTLAIAPDGRTLVSGDVGGTIRLWDLATGRPLGSLEGHTGPMRFAFSADGRFLASAASSVVGPRSEVWLWELSTRRVVARLGGLEGRLVNALGFEPGDATLWVHVYVGRFARGGGPAIRPRGRSVPATRGAVLALAAPGPCDSRRPDRGGRPGRGRGTGPLEWPGRKDGPGGVGDVWVARHSTPFAATPDARTVAAAMPGGAVVCRDTATGAEVARFEPGSTVFRLVFSPDGRTLAAGCDSGVVHLWDLATGRALRLPVSDSSRSNRHVLARVRAGRLEAGGE